ncbi:MAG: SMC-Scp complex subunit ScpB [Candidatus Omnitrophica bacterium]|nr:SMC-Scp complex subunit ScpB [Candidatus Omnitrophota bacterium]MBU4148809.1 SMC-Scp complex subunit ScpB [Candidatus Omnitrophota bacterium]
MDKTQAKNIIEAMFFVSDKPLFVNEIKGVLEDLDIKEVKEIIAWLAKEYEDTQRAFRLKEIAGGYQIVTDTVFAPWLQKLYKTSGADRLRGPSLETLAIIAYKQPVTKPEIEAIRGVNVDGVLKTIIEKNLIRIAGRKETVGRPILYGTTSEFLQYFGLNSLDELPRLEEFNITEKDIELPEHLRKEEEESQNPEGAPRHKDEGQAAHSIAEDEVKAEALPQKEIQNEAKESSQENR